MVQSLSLWVTILNVSIPWFSQFSLTFFTTCWHFRDQTTDLLVKIVCWERMNQYLQLKKTSSFWMKLSLSRWCSVCQCGAGMKGGLCMSATVTSTAPTTSLTNTHTDTHSFFKFTRSNCADETFSSQKTCSTLHHVTSPRSAELQSALFIPEPKYDCKLQSAKDWILNDLCNKWFRPWGCGEQARNSWRGGTEEEEEGGSTVCSGGGKKLKILD